MSLRTMGWILFIGAILVFAIFCFAWYLPQTSADPSNSETFATAIWWSAGCGIVGLIGLIILVTSNRE